MDPFNHLESLRRTQELAAGGVIATQMRRARELQGAFIKQAGFLESYGRQARGTVEALLDTSAVQRGIAGLTTVLGTTTPRATARTFPVTVEETQEPEAASAPQPVTEDRPIDRSFILKQMIEAKDEEAQAACCRYILRNGLLES